ncbi:MAG: DUF2384 domain-containing protein [Cyclobacteriaceae bacterium]
MSNVRKPSKHYSSPDTIPHSVAEAAVVYNTPVKMVHLSRNGLPPDFVIDLIDSYAFSKQEASRLVDISAKTFDRHLQSGKSFSGLQSDRLLELADLFQEGIDVFGSRDKFLGWLNSEIAALGNTTPKDWLDTHKGILMISDELGRIKHGIFA